MSKLKIFLVVCLSHFSASTVFVLLVSIYDRLNGNKEAWPVIGIAIMLALTLEILIILKLFQHPSSINRLFKALLLVLTSWLIGLINFLTLGNWLSFLPVSTALFSWLVSLTTLFILMLVSTRPQT